MQTYRARRNIGRANASSDHLRTSSRKEESVSKVAKEPHGENLTCVRPPEGKNGTTEGRLSYGERTGDIVKWRLIYIKRQE